MTTDSRPRSLETRQACKRGRAPFRWPKRCCSRNLRPCLSRLGRPRRTRPGLAGCCTEVAALLGCGRHSEARQAAESALAEARHPGGHWRPLASATACDSDSDSDRVTSDAGKADTRTGKLPCSPLWHKPPFGSRQRLRGHKKSLRSERLLRGREG